MQSSLRVLFQPLHQPWTETWFNKVAAPSAIEHESRDAGESYISQRTRPRPKSFGGRGWGGLGFRDGDAYDEVECGAVSSTAQRKRGDVATIVGRGDHEITLSTIITLVHRPTTTPDLPRLTTDPLVQIAF